MPSATIILFYYLEAIEGYPSCTQLKIMLGPSMLTL